MEIPEGLATESQRVIDVVTVHYHTPGHLARLVIGLGESPLVRTVVIVNNGGRLSIPAPQDLSFPVEIIEAGENVGFAAGVNLGLTLCRGPWVLVVNPDVRIDSKALTSLFGAAESFNAPLSGPRFYWDDDHIFRLPPASGYAMWLDVAFRSAWSWLVDREILSHWWSVRHDAFWSRTTPFYEPFLSGACLLLNLALLRELGEPLWDERFFLYFEDTDLFARLLKRGLRPLCVPGAEVVHYYDQAPPPGEAKARFMERSKGLFMRKHFGGEAVLPGSGRGDREVGSFEDLGPCVDPPVFSDEMGLASGEGFFELAVNPFFVPFAQAGPMREEFSFPRMVWDKMAGGVYWARVRSGAHGVVGSWTFRKENGDGGDGDV